jgi:hypothetical protein
MGLDLIWISKLCDNVMQNNHLMTDVILAKRRIKTRRISTKQVGINHDSQHCHARRFNGKTVQR